ncbi:short-chain dehydrogenase, partial [Coprinopsis marcescibilis]
MQPTFCAFIKTQRAEVPPVIHADLAGKVVLVVGGNTGIGYETAKHFAQMNPAKVIIACRSQERGRAAVAKMRQETGFDNIELKIVDLAKFSSVVAFSDDFIKEEKRLDILIANAAVSMEDYTTTSDGWEMTLQVNNLSTLLFCIRLAPLLIETAEKNRGTHPRLVILGSTLHYDIRKFERKVLESNNPLRALSSRESSTSSNMLVRYSESKLLVVFMMRSLANILKNKGVIVNSVCPGYCSSELQRNVTGPKRVLFKGIEMYMAWTAEEGSRQVVWAALANEDNAGTMNDVFCSAMKVQETSDFSISSSGRKAQEDFWTNFIEELSKVDPKVPEILRD